MHILCEQYIIQGACVSPSNLFPRRHHKFIFHTVIVSSRSSRHEIWRTSCSSFSVSLYRPREKFSDELFHRSGGERRRAGGGRVASVHLPRGLCSDCQRVLLFSDGGKALANSYRETRFERALCSSKWDHLQGCNAY